jgi:hypothetical protein
MDASKREARQLNMPFLQFNPQHVINLGHNAIYWQPLINRKTCGM